MDDFIFESAPILQSGLVGLMPLVPLMAGQNLEELYERVRTRNRDVL